MMGVGIYEGVVCVDGCFCIRMGWEVMDIDVVQDGTEAGFLRNPCGGSPDVRDGCADLNLEGPVLRVHCQEGGVVLFVKSVCDVAHQPQHHVRRPQRLPEPRLVVLQYRCILQVCAYPGEDDFLRHLGEYR